MTEPNIFQNLQPMTSEQMEAVDKHADLKIAVIRIDQGLRILNLQIDQYIKHRIDQDKTIESLLADIVELKKMEAEKNALR